MRPRVVVLERLSPNLIEHPAPNNQRQSDDPVGEDDRGPQQCNCLKRFPHCQGGSQDTRQPSNAQTGEAIRSSSCGQKALLPVAKRAAALMRLIPDHGIIWFGLNGLLWYAKPSDLVWLAGSAILGVIFFAGFFGYLALAAPKAQTEISKPGPEERAMANQVQSPAQSAQCCCSNWPPPDHLWIGRNSCNVGDAPQ
jgi:hypothetical protein